jgi:hypothetical protein
MKKSWVADLMVGLVGELDLKIIGVRADVTFIQLGSDLYDDSDGSILDFQTNLNYLNIGVSVKKSIGPAYVYAGPYFAYALSGKWKYKYEESGVTDESDGDLFGEGDDNLFGQGDLYNTTDFGANLGIGASFMGVFVEAYAGYGFLNLINLDSDNYDQNSYAKKDDETQALGEDAKANNYFFGVSAGYMFGF